MAHREVVICAPVRTAIGAYRGALSAVSATDLGAYAIAETLRRSGLAAERVGSVVMGNVLAPCEELNPARVAAIAGGLPPSVPAATVNRVCGSSAQALATAAQEILLGYTDIAVAGGMENLDQASCMLPTRGLGDRMGGASMYYNLLRDGADAAVTGEHAGWRTEELVSKFGISRHQQDSWAARSQQRFSAAQAKGRFDTQIVGVLVNAGSGTKRFARDEGNRPGTNIDSLAKIRPAFKAHGDITEGNASALNTGASAMVVAERDAAEKRGLHPWARLVAFGVGSVEPGRFGLGSVPAVRQAIGRAGWDLKHIDRIEINETFAAVPLAVMRELGVPYELVNVEGGAVAHGHAVGAAGAILTTRLLHSMRADGLKRGVVTLSMGGGQGIAIALEML
jgi:acetyl-CoA C-acetyltransferase